MHPALPPTSSGLRLSKLRRRVAMVAASLAVVAALWATVLATVGGFDTQFAGFRIRSNSANRPLTLSFVALVVCALSVGWSRLVAESSRRLGAVDILVHKPRFLISLAALSALGVFAAGVLGATGVAGGADSFGYMSQAELWRSGLPSVRQPWSSLPPWPSPENSFAPLGYRAVGDTLVPIYAVGLPLLMAFAKALGGQAAMFLLAPLAGAVLVVATYRIGATLATATTGGFASFLIATNYTLLVEITSPMADVIGAAGLCASLSLLIQSRPRALAAGLFAAVAVLVRPNLVPTLVPLMYCCLTSGRERQSHSYASRVQRLALFLAGVLPGLVIPAWANYRLFGSPSISGYGSVREIYEWSSGPPNLTNYPGFMLETNAYIALLGLPAILLALVNHRLSSGAALHWLLALFLASVVGPYLFFEPAVETRYLRYLLPAAPVAFVAGVALLQRLAARVESRWLPVGGAVIAGVCLVHGIVSVRYTVAKGAFDHRIERRYPVVAGIVRHRTADSSVVFAAQHSGSLRYYGGRVTLHFDRLDSQSLDTSIDWLVKHGAHPYLLVDYWELPLFRSHFAGQKRAAALDQPLVVYRTGYDVYLFDLAPEGVQQRPEIVHEPVDARWFPEPVAMPATMFK